MITKIIYFFIFTVKKILCSFSKKINSAKLNLNFIVNIFRKSSRMKNVKEIFISWSKSVDINVYTKMLEYSPNYKVQFIWLLILLGSTGGTFYFISKSILDYLKYEVVSQTTLINEYPIVFQRLHFAIIIHLQQSIPKECGIMWP